MNIVIILVGLIVGAVGIYTLRVARQMQQGGVQQPAPPEPDPIAELVATAVAPRPAAAPADPERAEHRRALEDLAGISAGQAKRLLMQDLEDETRREIAGRLRELEREAQRDAARRARSILAVAMQRLAAKHVADTTVTLVPLESNDLKGRIIGREGRNIRMLEHLTGVDIIIDDTPDAVVLSSFDGVRREIARLTLERLLADGRVNPARIEETYQAARADLERTLVVAGEEAELEAGVSGLAPAVVALLGRLRFRTSYGQNVLAHSVECALLAGLMADELGASAATARRAALLHDIGKALTQEVEGPHAIVGAEFLRRHGEPDAVAHAVEAHHNEIEPRTVEAVLVQTADTLSGARPGARSQSLETYVKRLRDLEVLAGRHEGVERVFVMQAGREIRVFVEPGKVDDDAAALLAREIAREVESELDYPGQIKVTVIREARAIQFAS
jgi:ribonuclease Y